MKAQDISNEPQSSDENPFGKNNEIRHDALNPIPSKLEKACEQPEEKESKASKITGYCTYKGIIPKRSFPILWILSDGYYELDPETDIMVITYKGEKKYSEYIERKPHELKDNTCKNIHPDYGDLIVLSLFIVGILVFIGVLPEGVIFLVLFVGFYCMIIKAGNTGMHHVDSEALEYLESSHCNKCGRDFACEESKAPEIRERSTPKAYRITVISYWKCKYCGYENIRERPAGIKAWKKGFAFLLGPGKLPVPCQKCGKEKAYREFRKPDIKKLSNTIQTITSYYKCRYCGHIEVKVEEIEEAEPYFP